MISVILSWVYILLICLFIGMGTFKLLSKLFNVNFENFFAEVICGVTVITVYTEYFSIFYKISILAHLIMLIAALISAYICKKRVLEICNSFKNIIKNKSIIPWLFTVLVVAFFTSRGVFHTDTGIYHAQTIRIYEEYGIIKGLANLQLHFGYNSAYLAFCSIFTFSFILPEALHTTTGFLTIFCLIYALSGLRKIREHKKHGADGARIAILLYILTNITGSMSPATDYGTMYLILYLLTEWLATCEEKSLEKNDETTKLSLLSVLAIFIVSVKLSGAGIVLLALYPLVILIKQKRYRDIWIFLGLGFFSFLPYMIRNVILTGWLFYPVSVIDLFNVSWKVPLASLEKDAAQISVWGKCLYDVTKKDYTLSQWFPIWWEGQYQYEQMLLVAQLIGVLLLLLKFDFNLIKHYKLDFKIIIFYIMLVICELIWFFNAPFVRYGLAFLLMLPLCAAGDVMIDYKRPDKRGLIIYDSILVLIFICFTSWINQYFMDDVVFVYHYLKSDTYVWQQPFDDSETETLDIDGVTVYYSVDGEINSYYNYPSSCYKSMAESCTLIGDTIEEGFMPKENN